MSVPFKDFRVTTEDLRNCGWQEAITQATGKEVSYYESPLSQAAKIAAETGDERREHALALLYGATSMYFDDDDSEEPYKPMFVTQSGRSPALADFEEHHLQPLSEFYKEVPDDELRARLADLLWVKRRDHVAARVAVATYVRIAEVEFDPQHWTHCFHRLQRAMQIAASLGRDTKEKTLVADIALQILRKLNGTDPLYLSRSIIQLLLDHKVGEAVELAQFARKCAESAEKEGDWMRAGDYWSFAAECLRKGNDTAAVSAALIQAGHAYFNVGELMFGNSGLAADHWIERAFLLYRQAGAPEELQAKARNRLAEAQQRMMESLRPIETRTEIPAQIIEHLDQARGLPFREALIFLSAQAPPTPRGQLKESVLKSFEEHPLSGLFGTNILREGGKTDVSIPPLSLDGENEERTVEMHMWRRNVLYHALYAGMVNYVRRIVANEHPWSDDCLDWLLRDNDFIPRGREGIYRVALKAGLAGDFLVSTHLLIPLLENSFRHVLHEAGFVTTVVRDDGQYDERSLNQLICLPAFASTFGEDLTFELRGMLVERAGSNLRNATCHGLIHEGEFYTPENVLLFSHAIRLLVMGMPDEQRDDTASKNDQSQDDH